MKTKIVTIKSKTPELREINDFGAKGWSLDQVKDIHNEGVYVHTEYHYHKTPFITHLLSFLFNWR